MSVLPAFVKQLVERLDPGSFTAFVEALVLAEASRLNMAPTDAIVSDAIFEGDEGLDILSFLHAFAPLTDRKPPSPTLFLSEEIVERPGLRATGRIHNVGYEQDC